MENTPYFTTPARWSLDDLFPSPADNELAASLQALEQQVVSFETRRPELNGAIPPANFLEAIQALEQIHKSFDRIHGFAGLRFTEDTQDQQAQTLLARVEQLAAEIENRTLFFSLWWKDLDEANATRLLAEAGDYHYWLELLRRFKPHTLSESEERIVNLKNVTGVQAARRVYDTITNRYTFKLKGVPGVAEEKELNREELMTYVRHPDGEVRKRAYDELYRVFSGDAHLLGQIYQTLVRDWYNENVQLRSFADPNAARNLENDVPDAVVDTLLEVCQANAPLFQRFFHIKARELGVQRLRRYDLYAPVAKPHTTYPFAQAVEWTLACFEDFDARMAQLGAQVLASRHMDSENRKGKRSGAFSWSVVNDLAPWVLLNYQGQADDVTTLAHEMGHAVHAMLAGQHSLFTYQACLPLAETASTFAEMLILDKMLAQEKDPAARRSLLFQQVDDAYATILRQSFFAIFERQGHTLIQEGASVDEVASAYLETLHTQFGDSVDLADIFRWEWVAIPHFYHSPFYVYAYAFGQLLVLALYRQYKLEGNSFKPRYIQILSAGGSQSPLEILAQAGIDARQAVFWQGGFDVIRDWIDALAQA